MKPTYPPHPPPNPEWPDHVKVCYKHGCERINELRKQIGEDGMIPIPFQCYGCDKMKCDFAMLTGDGVPLCDECIGNMSAAITKDLGRDAVG